MHTRASNYELVETLLEPERTLNRRRRRQNKRVPFDQRNNPPKNMRIVYPPILDINHFRHFLVTLENLYPMDDEPMWAANHVFTPTPGSAIIIPKLLTNFLTKFDRLADKQSGRPSGSLPNGKDSKGSTYFGRLFLPTAAPGIRVNQKQLNLGVGTERMIFNIDSTMKHSYLNDDTCFSIDVINEILEEDFDALLNKGSKTLYPIEGTLLEEEIFIEFDEFIGQFGLSMKL
ncbi:hypothetical protein Tco_1418670 [Tanacetum coccineum]